MVRSLLTRLYVDDVGSAGGCLHCGSPLQPSAADGYCCGGCRFVHDLLREARLERYYSLRGPKGDPIAEPAQARDRKWLEPVEAALAGASGIHRVDLDVQGLSCAACVWLIEQLFRKEPGGAGVLVNPALGRIHLSISRGFPLRRFVERVESCGYLLGPRRKSESSASSGLLLRMGITIAIAMNGMILAFSLYAGLSEGPLFSLFHALSFGLATLGVAVGGSYFLASAAAALRRGVLHLDLPIALGILLAYGSSTWAWLSHGLTSYFDTLNVFIALMLVGRFLQQRVIERNRRRLLADDGIDGLYARRVEGDQVALVRAAEIRAGDRLLLAPGDVVPVASALEGEGDGAASFSLDWINGESAPRAFTPGDEVPAGAFLSGTRAVTAAATADFGAGSLVDLLRAGTRDEREASRGAAFWRRFARVYVAAVLLLAAGALAVGLWATRDGRAAVERVTAVLIVTCPCAFGIAAPLAYEIVQARLRREGLFVRSPGFLDRAALVRTVVFDKTGTLTTGRLRLADASAARALEPEELQVLKNLAARSPHPKSAAVARALGTAGFLPDLGAFEVPGRGVTATYRGRVYRLGAPAWVSGGATSDDEQDIAFGADGEVRCSLRTVEDLRPDAAAEVRALREAGHDVWIASGDAPERVARVAEACGIPAEQAMGGMSAEDKAAWVRERDRGDLLFVGDGINDALVADVATASGTPAIDRPFLAARSDFYLVTPGLAPVRSALSAARRLRDVLSGTLAVALAYNALTVALAYAGLMSPLLCAVLMPLSSLSTILAVLLLLAPRAQEARTIAPAPARAPAGAA